mmetsp:Transcript_13393/g.38562  ORF Transcript_13393/g.38562 Transcript_13393/m.38562 type:complete len:335 (+) Transcript_13393:138-1142(+)|eukprot:CAMPEP_0119561128 /NCGR_PEP_ID=MMETSP1352-20130426/16765_1 /TAXON_ID=265584 /ORGANISM="Stauroneis constricta, Strain CCMP1120" /LENGTH=334 /DNA_ID=CAMNT_0007609259 /DNA_START=73 /DNA_END=1077 /DNA_ORIENTATION=+
MSLFAPASSVVSPSPSAPAILLAESSTDAVTEVIVHPMVLLHVLDHHTRRQQSSGRVIGTLLGRRDGRKVEVTNCFAVPHAEQGEAVAIGKDFNKQMLELHLKANKKEVVVGWYASAASGIVVPGAEDDKDEAEKQDDEEEEETVPGLIADTSSLIHDFYAGETEEGDPIHLVVDTRLIADTISVRAYRSTPVTLQGEALANLFHELRLGMTCSEAETLALEKIVGSQKGAAGEQAEEDKDNRDQLEISMEKLFERLETTAAYVDSVVDGTTTANAEVGRQIANTLASVPSVRPEVLDNLFNDSLQDLLMVTYLSKITKTQLTIADKLNASLGV